MNRPFAGEGVSEGRVRPLWVCNGNILAGCKPDYDYGPACELVVFVFGLASGLSGKNGYDFVALKKRKGVSS